MNITLTPEQAHLVRGKVATGKFASETAVIDKALHLLAQDDQAHQDWIKDLNQKIQEGLEELDRGEGIPGELVHQELKDLVQQVRSKRP